MKRKKPKMGIGTGISNPAGLKIFTWLILGLILVSVGLALPVPHGIDGKIYELDGITEVPAGTQFSVLNMNNGLAVFGTTGHVGTGGFSASLKGEDGDTIVVKAWNLYNEVELTLALAGVLHNVNLYLNMTYPAMPPNITSAPGTEATQGVPYSYQVTAVDGNNDNLDYGLAIWPEGMSINSGTGLITWTPQNEDVGVNFVSVYVNDGTYTVYQNFSINSPSAAIRYFFRNPDIQLKTGSSQISNNLLYKIIIGHSIFVFGKRNGIGCGNKRKKKQKD